MPTHCTITRFGFRTRRIDGVKCDLFSNHAPLGQTTLHVYLYSVVGSLGQDDCMCNCLCSVIVLCGMKMKGREKVKPGAGSQPALLESTKGAAKINGPIRRTNHHQQHYMPSQHTCCRRVWNLIQACDVQSSDQKVYISTPPSPEVEKISNENLLPRRGSNPGPTEPEADKSIDVIHLKFTVYRNKCNQIRV